MSIKDIKIGETYLLPVTATVIYKNGWLQVATCNEYGHTLAPTDVKTLLQNGIKNTEPAPKYDPNRLFRKGDIGTVIKDEEDTSFFVRLHLEGKYEKDMPYCHLELVTPVDELEPYHVVEDSVSFNVVKGNRIPVFFCKGSHPHAKAAAEAERDRLNAEWRKEQQ